VLDLSAGAGLVACLLAAAGARHVTASDLPDQLPQLRCNVERAGLSDRVSCCELWWGADVSSVRPRDDVVSGGAGPSSTRWFDLVVGSDILYIALRDSRTAELAATVRSLAQVSSSILWVFEERLPAEEEAFMAALRCGGGLGGGAPAPPLAVRELTGDAVALTYEQSLKGAGGHADTELWNPHLWWEPPPIRMFVINSNCL